MQKIILFDIDGTLLNVQRGFMRNLLCSLLQELELDPATLDTVRFAGRTDREIFTTLLGKRGSERALFNRLRSAYIARLNKNLRPRHVEVIHAVDEALHYCHQSDIPVGLLTGNFRESAFIKLNRAGLDHYFEHGAFGCDHHDRKHLPEMAAGLFEPHLQRPVEGSDLVIVGDTPNDIHAARHYGACAVGVATGHYSREQLEAARPDLLLDTLAEPARWLDEMECLNDGMME